MARSISSLRLGGYPYNFIPTAHYINHRAMNVPVLPRRRADNDSQDNNNTKKSSKKVRRVVSHKFRAQDFVRKRQNETIRDHYTLGKLLGEGQFGEVFVGTVNKSRGDDTRAIKRIAKDLLSEEDHDEVFNEFFVLKQMDHPNICKMYEFFEDADDFWFVQELCSGGELLDELERIENFNEATAGLIMRQVLSSVHYCHTQKRVVHRDLKLENILLEGQSAQAASSSPDDYNPMVVKVIDFGLSTKFEPGQILTAPVGSMHYIAPEVLEQEYQGGTCDIWSCGVIAYILLCGYAPFEAANDRDMRELIMMGHVSFDDPIWQDNVSEEAIDFVQYLLTYEPENRPNAYEALQHPWIQKYSKVHSQQFRATKSGTEAAMKVLSNCRSFEAASKLKQATCAFMTSQLVLSSGQEDASSSLHQASDSFMIGEVFRAMDLDSDGRLSLEELRGGFKDFMVGQQLTVEEVDDIFERMDLANSDYIEYSEFVVACMGLHEAQHQQMLQQAFERLLDRDGSGFISHEKLRNEMAPFYGDDVDEDVIQNIIDEADADQDGKISYEDFKHMMCKTADFVPPEDATPLEDYKPGSAKTTKKEKEVKETVETSAAEASAVEESPKPEVDTKETPAEPAEAPVPVPAVKAPSTLISGKRQSMTGPRARLIASMFERNMDNNEKMGFDKFAYKLKPIQSGSEKKRRLPRTRRVNFEELTKKASTQIDFDARKKMKQRKQELEILKGYADSKGKRDSLRKSFGSVTRRLEEAQRQLRLEELERVRESFYESTIIAQKEMEENWKQAHKRASLAEQRTSQMEAIKELGYFKEIFEQPSNMLESSEVNARRASDLPASTLVKRSRRGWTRHLSGKAAARDAIQRNQLEGAVHSRPRMMRTASQTMLPDVLEQEARLAGMQPKAKNKKLARTITPMRRLNSFDSDKDHDEGAQRLDEMASRVILEPNSDYSCSLHDPRCGRNSAVDMVAAQRQARLEELMNLDISFGGDGHNSAVELASAQRSGRLRELENVGPSSFEGGTNATVEMAAAQRGARLNELQSCKRGNNAKNARQKFEGTGQSDEKQHPQGKHKSRSVVLSSADIPKSKLMKRNTIGTDTGYDIVATAILKANLKEHNMSVASLNLSDHDEKKITPHKNANDTAELSANSNSSRSDPAGELNENSMTHIGESSFADSMGSIGAGSIADMSMNLSACPIAEDSPVIASPEVKKAHLRFERSAPELGLGSPRVEHYERPAPKIRGKHIVLPNNTSRNGTPSTPNSRRGRMSLKPRKGGSVSSGNKSRRRASAAAVMSSSEPKLTDAQQSFLDLAKERALQSKAPATRAS